MAQRRGSRNAIENRGKSTVMICGSCGSERKPFRMVAAGRSRMVYECKCGLLDKAGTKV